MPALSVMVKPSSGFCNIKCEYCFYHDIVCSRKEGQLGFMNEETCDNLVKKALAFAGADDVYFAFQGGEPLLSGIEFFKHFTESVKRQAYKGRVYFSAQTNGTLLNEEWAKFFKQHNFLLGVSLDGFEKANKFRVMADGSPTFEKVLQGIEILDKYRVDYNILSVVTGYFADNVAEIYSYFKDKNFRFLQFIPCLRPFGDKSESELFMTEEQYEKFMTVAFELYANDFLAGNYFSVRNFDNLVRLFCGGRAEQCGASGCCSFQFVVEGNGNVYPCDFYCNDKWLLGNINECDFKNLYGNEKAVKFVRESFEISKKCKECMYFAICRGGGCKREKESFDYCSAKKRFFKKSLPLFEKVAKKLKTQI